MRSAVEDPVVPPVVAIGGGADLGPRGASPSPLAGGAVPAHEQSGEAEQRILGDSLYRAEREHIVEFLVALRSAKTAADFTEFQLRLLGRAKARQQLASELRDLSKRRKRPGTMGTRGTRAR